MRSLIQAVLGDFCRCWKQLFLTDLLYKSIAVVLLTPLAAGLFGLFISMSGNTVLADQDLLFFFLTPLGWICLVIVGALRLGIVAIEQAALMGILVTPEDKRVGIIDALRFATASAWRVTRVTGHLIACTLLAAAPFALLAAVTYFTLLTEFDINYYLQQQPPVFQFSAGFGFVLSAMLAAVLLRLFTGWIFALPLVLFEDVSPAAAPRTSRQRAGGNRRILLASLVIWLLATIVISTCTTTAIIAVGRYVVPRAAGSLGLLTVAIGASLLIWTVVNLVISLLGATTLAALLLNLYRRFGADGDIDLSRLRMSHLAETSGRYAVTPGRVLVTSTLGIVLAAVVGIVAAQSVRLNDDVEIMAHRGSSKAAPENTMAAVRQAIEDDADWVEIDVQETADGEVVVFHDSDFMKLAGVNLKIWNATMADLKEIDIGSRFHSRFKQERVPTLAQVLRECDGKIGVNIELKYYGHDQMLEQRVVDIVEANEMVDRVICMSLKLDAVKKLKSLRPTWRIGLLMSVSSGDLSRIDADFLAVNARFVDRGLVRRAHAINKQVLAWTVNDAVSMSTMIGRGVDGLITDKPALARSVLDQRAEMGPAQRLILELAEIFGVASEIGQQ